MKRSKPLRKASADIEARLWAYLRRLNLRGYRFRRRAMFQSFLLDFVDHQALLAIELCDGAPGKPSPQIARHHVLAAAGYTVLRLWSDDLRDHFSAAIAPIAMALEDRPKPEL